MDYRNWDFDSGNLVLDFANTAEWHASQQPSEYLRTYPDLVAWSLDAGLLDEGEAQQLLQSSEKHPREAALMLEKAISLREILYRMLSANSHCEPLDKDDLSRFNRYLAESLGNSQVVPAGEGFSWTWQAEDNALDRVLWQLVRQAADLITSKDLDRVGECADDRGCGYLFMDTSRNHSRLWCSMDACGNRAKAQRHYQKKSEPQSN